MLYCLLLFTFSLVFTVLFFCYFAYLTDYLLSL